MTTNYTLKLSFLSIIAVHLAFLSGNMLSAATSITVANNVRTIISIDTPDHGIDNRTTYATPITRKSHAYKIDATPHKNLLYTKYKEPHAFGIAVNGILFDPFSPEYYNHDRHSGWQINAKEGHLGLDKFGAHVQPDGNYHYHTTTPSLFKAFNVKPSEHSPLIGYAADGFPIYANYVYSDPKNSKSVIVKLKSNYRLKKGHRKKEPKGTYDGTYIEDYEFVKGLNGNLNKANARYGITPDYPDGTWYYVLLDNFPYIPHLFIGTPDPSFNPRYETPNPDVYHHPNLMTRPIKRRQKI